MNHPPLTPARQFLAALAIAALALAGAIGAMRSDGQCPIPEGGRRPGDRADRRRGP